MNPLAFSPGARLGSPRCKIVSEATLRKRKQRERNADGLVVLRVPIDLVAAAPWLRKQGFACHADCRKSVTKAMAAMVKAKSTYEL